MASKKLTRKTASPRTVFNATYAILMVLPPCGPRSCAPLLTLCGKSSIECGEYSLVHLVAPTSREAKEMLKLVRQIRRLQPRLGIVIEGKPGDVRRMESALKRL